MTRIIRCMVMAVVPALWMATVSEGDDAAPAADAAAATDAAPTANPQASDEVESEAPAATDAPADEGDPAAEKAGDAADPTPDQSGSTDGDDEPSAEEQAFLADPFTSLQGDMQSATVDLKEGETRQPASVTQPRILNHLDLLIEQLERQGSGAGQAGQRVNQPAQQSSLMRGPGGQNEMRAPRDDGRDWAELTPQERQKILQSKTDGFPAGYDDILADYFRRVARAQESAQTAPEEAGAGAPSGADGSTPAQPSSN